MPAKFEWKKTRERIREAARSSERAVGYALHFRRLHLGLTQTQVARRVSKALGIPKYVRQHHIDQLEDGKMPPPFRDSDKGIRALLQALKWQPGDVTFMEDMIENFGTAA